MKRGFKLRCIVAISIHAPVKGATSLIPISQVGVVYFNPRTREGCDIIIFSKVIEKVSISIHAPVKGATQKIKFYAGCIRISIHAPVKGATLP